MISSKTSGVYLSDQGGDDNPRVTLSTDAGTAQEWLVVNPFLDFLPSYTGVWQIPLTTVGRFLLLNSSTQRYLGVMPPPGSSAADNYGYFTLGGSFDPQGHYVISDLTTQCSEATLAIGATG